PHSSIFGSQGAATVAYRACVSVERSLLTGNSEGPLNNLLHVLDGMNLSQPGIVNFLQANSYFRLPILATFPADSCYQETLEASKAFGLLACSESSEVVLRPDFTVRSS